MHKVHQRQTGQAVLVLKGLQEFLFFCSRDLKPENVLLSVSGDVKLSDFGLGHLPSSSLHNDVLQTTCGTPNYVAPEVLRREGYYGAPADIWSLGWFLLVCASRLHHTTVRVCSAGGVEAEKSLWWVSCCLVGKMLTHLHVNYVCGVVCNSGSIWARLQLCTGIVLLLYAVASHGPVMPACHIPLGHAELQQVCTDLVAVDSVQLQTCMQNGMVYIRLCHQDFAYKVMFGCTLLCGNRRMTRLSRWTCSPSTWSNKCALYCITHLQQRLITHISSAVVAGVLLYVIMAGNLPFDEPNLPSLFKKIARADYPSPPWFTPEMDSLFKMMLDPLPNKRCSSSLARLYCDTIVLASLCKTR